MPHFDLITRSSNETIELGNRFGALAQPYDLICLNGDLGAGKTTFVQGVAAGLGIDPLTVTSPTYALIAEHRQGRVPFYHMDAYRLSANDDLAPIGFDDCLADSGLMVIEWSEKIKDSLPHERITITISAVDNDEQMRTISIDCNGERAESYVTQVVNQP